MFSGAAEHNKILFFHHFLHKQILCVCVCVWNPERYLNFSCIEGARSF